LSDLVASTRFDRAHSELEWASLSLGDVGLLLTPEVRSQLNA